MKNKVVIAGAGILDVLVQPVRQDVFTSGSVSVDHIRISTGGDALNEATVLARLKRFFETEGRGYAEDQESAVYLLSLLGTDKAGMTIAAHCEAEGISTELITQDEKEETGINVVMIQEDGSRSFFTNPKSTLRRLGLQHFPEKFPEDASVFCLGSIFVSPLLEPAETAAVFVRAKEQGMIVCADMTRCKKPEMKEDMKKALKDLDYLFANEEEAGILTEKAQVPDMAEELYNCGVKNVIIKCGKDGCYVKNAETDKTFPAVSGTNCIDTTGAGDSFAGGFLYALSEGKTLKNCIAWANVCGSLATEAVGATDGIRSRWQVEERLKRYLSADN